MTEMDLLRLVRLKMSELGICCFRVNVGKVKTEDGRCFDTGLPKGFSDLLCIKDGRAYFIELKVGNNKPSKEQLNFIKQMKERYGCGAGVAYSVEEAVRIVGGNING
jgi:hypothetical protein